MNSLLEVRHVPKALAWMRVQVGRMETRPLEMPIYPTDRSRVPVGHQATETKVTVFRLLGYGATQAEAERMASLKPQVSNLP